MYNPFVPLPAFVPFNSMIGALDHPGWVCPSRITGSEIVGSADAGATEATPPENMLV